MAIITKIEEQKNKKRVNIFVDNAFFCGLNKETAVIFRLKVGNEVDENLIKDAIFDSEVKSAVEKANDYIGTRMHSKRELYEKLLKKGYEKRVIMTALDKLEEYHYVDDNLFAKLYAEQNKKYSKKMLENKLMQKGISADIIHQIIGTDDDFQEIELCKKQAEKYAKSKDLSQDGVVQKMYASLARKGFSFDVIKQATKHLLSENNEDYDFSD